ncbi:MAG: response regulator transcription factor [Opitutaceae bacterium]|nr:response regulator transcription factor [Opitutaceae bacterium]
MLKSHPNGAVQLSRAEAAVVALLTRGLSNGEIARAQGKSLGTIKNQLSSAYRKLGVRSRTRLMAVFEGVGSLHLAFLRPAGRRW